MLLLFLSVIFGILTFSLFVKAREMSINGMENEWLDSAIIAVFAVTVGLFFAGIIEVLL